jgi:site-specific DNA recombinase
MLDAFGYELADIGKKGIMNDDGFSGKDLNRPGIQKILEDVNKKRRSFDGIIFFRLDRLTRNPRDLYSLIDLFRDNDIDFISVRENLDSSTAIGRVVIGILGLLSAFERELTGERVKASAIARVRQGRWVGGRLPYGYKLVDNGARLPNGTQPHKIMLDEDVAPRLKLAWELAADNKSLTAIGLELQKRGLLTSTGKAWRRQALSHLIKNPFYKGYIQYSDEMHKGTQDIIVDEKLWERANRILTAKLPGHNFVPKAKEYIYLLAGLLKCGDCGSHMMCNFSAGRGKRKFFYYECNRAKQSLGCANKRISATVFDNAVIDYFKRASKDQEIITKAIGNAILESQIKLESLGTKTKEKEEQLNALRHESKKLLDLAMDGTISQGSTFKEKMTALETEIARVEAELSKLQAQKRIAQMNAHSGEFLHHNLSFAMQYLDKAPVEAQKSLIRALIKDIVIYEDKIAVNMFISEPIQDILPSTLPEMTPQKVKRPTQMSEALTGNHPVSDSRPNWLPFINEYRNALLELPQDLLCHESLVMAI